MEDCLFEPQKASIYQISLRTFTPEGTLKAAEKLLPFLSRLGPRYLQLCPVVLADDDMNPDHWSTRQKASGTGNPKNTYRIKDYFATDIEYGTDEDLYDFVQTAHRLGMRVIFDLVYYHCGPRAVFLSDHPDFVKRDENGQVLYGEWAFPVLNFECAGLREYLWDNMLYFLKAFNIDGYRCDVGDRVPLDFWEEGIRRVRAVKPDFLMINEGRLPEYLRAFDANYFYDGCFDAVPVAKGELTAEDFRRKWELCRQTLPPGGRMLHFIDNHDVCSDSGEDRHEKTIGTDGVDALLVLNFLLDGIPFIFNGYEVADGLKHNMFANRFFGRDATVNWANYLCEKGQKRFELLRTLFHLRGTREALYSTDIIWANHSAPDQVLAFYRPDPRQAMFAVINMTSRPVSFTLDALPPGMRTMVPDLVKNTSWCQSGDKLEIQQLGFAYLVTSY